MNYLINTRKLFADSNSTINKFPVQLLERVPAEVLDSALKQPKVMSNVNALQSMLKNPNLTKEHHAAIVSYHEEMGQNPFRQFHHSRPSVIMSGTADLELNEAEQQNRMLLGTALLNHRFTNRNDISRILKNTDSVKDQILPKVVKNFVGALDRNPNFKSSHIDEIMKTRPEDFHQHARNLGVTNALIGNLPDTRYNNSHIDSIIENFSNPHPVAKQLNTNENSAEKAILSANRKSGTDKESDLNLALQHRFSEEANQSLSAIVAKLQSRDKLTNRHYNKIFSSESSFPSRLINQLVGNAEYSYRTPRSKLDFYYTHAPAIAKYSRNFFSNRTDNEQLDRYDKSQLESNMTENMYTNSADNDASAVDLNRHNLSALTGLVDNALHYGKENVDLVKRLNPKNAFEVASHLDSTHINSFMNIFRAYKIHEIHADKQELVPRGRYPWPEFDASKATQKVGDTHRPLGDALTKEQLLKFADLTRAAMKTIDADGNAILPNVLDTVLPAIQTPILKYRKLRQDMDPNSESHTRRPYISRHDEHSGKTLNANLVYTHPYMHDSSEPNFPVSADHDVVKKFLSIPDSKEEFRKNAHLSSPGYRSFVHHMSLDRNLSYENAKLLHDKFGEVRLEGTSVLATVGLPEMMRHVHHNFNVWSEDASGFKQVPYYHNFDIHPDTGEILPKASS